MSQTEASQKKQLSNPKATAPLVASSAGHDFRSKVAALACRLEPAGLSILSVVEPSSTTPGQVHITQSIYVVVPGDGGPMVVVLVHSDGFLDHGRPRKRIGNVVDDVTCAIYQVTPRP